MNPQDIWIWLVFGFLCLSGFMGMFVPFLPGTIFLFMAVLLHKLFLPEFLLWWTVGGMAVLSIALWIFEIFSGALGAKWGGAGKWGILGAALGGILGIFFAPIGLIAGPILGAMLGELIWGGKHIVDSFRSGVGAGVGMLMSLIMRTVVGFIMLIWIAIDLIW